MQLLISKIQYNNFEAGEFVDIKERSYEEVIKLIEGFPWTKQRENLVVSLTNPSITIEGTNNDYLKIALYYNGKYVLYYFDSENKLYKKSFEKLEESYSYIYQFFEQFNFQTTGLKKENTWMQKNQPHFITDDFRYYLTPKLVEKFSLNTTFYWIIAIDLLVLLKTILRNGIQNTEILESLLKVFLFCLIFFSFNIFLLVYFYLLTRNKILIISKGNPIFYYGNILEPFEYKKSEVESVTTIQARGRVPFRAFSLVSIKFKDGNKLAIPNMLIDQYLLNDKFPGITKIDISAFPYAKNKSKEN